jgi:hypothetical protein
MQNRVLLVYFSITEMQSRTKEEKLSGILENSEAARQYCRNVSG